MVSLLGTIARSGSKAFVAEARAGAGGNSEADSKAANSIIGQFGVRNKRRGRPSSFERDALREVRFLFMESFARVDGRRAVH